MILRWRANERLAHISNDRWRRCPPAPWKCLYSGRNESAALPCKCRVPWTWPRWRRRSPWPAPTGREAPRWVSWIRGRCWASRGIWPSPTSSAGWWSSRDRRSLRTAKLIELRRIFSLRSNRPTPNGHSVATFDNIRFARSAPPCTHPQFYTVAFHSCPVPAIRNGAKVWSGYSI